MNQISAFDIKILSNDFFLFYLFWNCLMMLLCDSIYPPSNTFLCWSYIVMLIWLLHLFFSFYLPSNNIHSVKHPCTFCSSTIDIPATKYINYVPFFFSSRPCCCIYQLSIGVTRCRGTRYHVNHQIWTVFWDGWWTCWE